MELWLYDHSDNTRRTVNVNTDPIVVGRDDTCDLVLKGPFVARKHAKITRRGNQFFVQNLSRSGTMVANRDITDGQEARIDFGDEIQIAQFSLALISPGRKADKDDSRQGLQRRLVDLEQKIHQELLDRLNLRMTGGIKKGDAAYNAQVLNTLEGIIENHLAKMDDALAEHTIYTQLHRMVIAEVVRQGQGKVQTEYQTGAKELLDPKLERDTRDVVTSMVDMMPLLFDPSSINEDLTVAEEAFDDLFDQTKQSIQPSLRSYLIKRTISKDLQDIMFGLGPLQDLLDMANVSEIMVVGKDHIYVEKNGVIQPASRTFFSDEVLLSVIERILTPVGRRIDTSSPLVDARLADGSRINVIISPLSLVGPCITIRKFGWVPFTIDDLIERGSISERCASFLRGCVIGRKNIIISGGTGSGKTTLLNTLAAYARPSERIITIEESAELRLPQPHVVALEGRPANIEGKGEYNIRDLVRNALRMRPDRIIVGEVRGPEALDMLQAMNTGHDGSLSTLHSNNPDDAMHRMETLVLMAIDMPVRAIREQIVSAVHLVVQIARFSDGRRRVTHISEVTQMDRDTGEILIDDIFRLHRQEDDRLSHTGFIPTFSEDLIARGILDVEVFL